VCARSTTFERRALASLSRARRNHIPPAAAVPVEWARVLCVFCWGIFVLYYDTW
jgi:hypothetical protein